MNFDFKKVLRIVPIHRDEVLLSKNLSRHHRFIIEIAQSCLRLYLNFQF